MLYFYIKQHLIKEREIKEKAMGKKLLKRGYVCSKCSHEDVAKFDETEINQGGKGFCCPKCIFILWVPIDGPAIHYNRCAEESLEKSTADKAQ